jgi:hypothetical protein
MRRYLVRFEIDALAKAKSLRTKPRFHADKLSIGIVLWLMDPYGLDVNKLNGLEVVEL